VLGRAKPRARPRRPARHDGGYLGYDQSLADINEGSSLVCQPSWTRALTAAQHLSDLARLRRVRDRIDREYARPLDVEALARGAHMSAGDLSREFKLAYGESPYGYLMTRRIERATALLQRGDLRVTEVCFAVGCSSLGTFSTRFTELTGVPPSTYRRQTAGNAVVRGEQVTRPVRNREARVSEPRLA
jgi:AraC-like DNA-binding protein